LLHDTTMSTVCVNRWGLTGCNKVYLNETDTILDLFVDDGFSANDRSFELFISPTMKRLDRTRTIGSYGIKDNANIYVLPVNTPKPFEPLEESLMKIVRMEYQQQLLDEIAMSHKTAQLNQPVAHSAAAGAQAALDRLVAGAQAACTIPPRPAWVSVDYSCQGDGGEGVGEIQEPDPVDYSCQGDGGEGVGESKEPDPVDLLASARLRFFEHCVY
jgi:hypothetical protein